MLERPKLSDLISPLVDKVIPNKQFFIALAAQLGYKVIDIDDMSKFFFKCDVSMAGDYLGEGPGTDSVIAIVNDAFSNGAKLEDVFNKLKHVDENFQFVYTR